ncbi:MAG: alpha/beta fold hydrolase [Thermoanaerobaculia bacterium]
MTIAIDRGSGPAIVWIHGFPLSSAIFEPQLSISGVRHVVPDLPGFGSAAAPEGAMTMDTYADAVARNLAELQITSATLAGVSMGGYIVFAMMRRHPKLANAAILIDTKEAPDSAEAREGRAKTAEAVRQDGVDVVISQMYPKMLTPETIALADWRSDTVMRAMRSSSVPGVTAALAAMAARPDSAETIRAASIPILAIAGDHDAITPPADAERMASLASDGTLAVIADAAHLSNVERPAEFNRTVQAFLDRLR